MRATNGGFLRVASRYSQLYFLAFLPAVSRYTLHAHDCRHDCAARHRFARCRRMQTLCRIPNTYSESQGCISFLFIANLTIYVYLSPDERGMQSVLKLGKDYEQLVLSHDPAYDDVVR